MLNCVEENKNPVLRGGIFYFGLLFFVFCSKQFQLMAGCLWWTFLFAYK